MLAMVLDPVLCVLRNRIRFWGKHWSLFRATDERSVVLTYLLLVRKRKKQNYWIMGRLQNSCFFFISNRSDLLNTQTYGLFCSLDHGLVWVRRWCPNTPKYRWSYQWTLQCGSLSGPSGTLKTFLLVKKLFYLIIGNQRSMKLRYWKLARLKLTRI